MPIDDDNFLGRWSKRKHAVRRGETPAEPARAEAAPPAPPAAQPPAAATPAASPELPPVDSLKGLESDYQDFLRPDVDPATKSAALRKLFGDPHFNRMDGLDTYIDDYSKEDPIPATMLRALNQARALGLFDDEEKVAAPGEPEQQVESAPVAAVEEAPPATIDTLTPAPALDAGLQPAATGKPDQA